MCEEGKEGEFEERVDRHTAAVKSFLISNSNNARDQ